MYTLKKNIYQIEKKVNFYFSLLFPTINLPYRRLNAKTR